MEWRHAARCRGHGTDTFFPPEGSPTPTAEARKICADCTVRTHCLDFAVRAGIDHGTWGGVSISELRRLRAALNTGSAIAYHQALIEADDTLGRIIGGTKDHRPAETCGRCGAPIRAGSRPIDRNGPDATCGLPSTYNKGCRCTSCVRAKSDYDADRRA